MEVTVKGKFISNIEKLNKDNKKIPYSLVLVGNEAVQIKNVHMSCQPMQDVEFNANAIAFDGKMYFTYVGK